jgi:Domain of unknown function (DUF4406)
MKLYVCGPMSGHKDHNFPAFRAAAKELEAAGYEVVDPSTFDDNVGRSWADCLKRDLPEMLKCDGVALLLGWVGSRGANLEHRVATELGMPRLYVVEWVERAGGRA